MSFWPLFCHFAYWYWCMNTRCVAYLWNSEVCCGLSPWISQTMLNGDYISTNTVTYIYLHEVERRDVNIAKSWCKPSTTEVLTPCTRVPSNLIIKHSLFFTLQPANSRRLASLHRKLFARVNISGLLLSRDEYLLLYWQTITLCPYCYLVHGHHLRIQCLSSILPCIGLIPILFPGF